MDTGTAIAFYILAGLTTISAIMVVSLRNIFHSVLFLVLSFAGIAGIYVTLNAEFVAAIQVLIYAGAIVVLMLFAMMLTTNAMTEGNPAGHLRPPAMLTAFLFFITVAYVGVVTPWQPRAASAPTDFSINGIADLLFNVYVLPFEISSVLLLVAMIGAIVLARD
ncbi:MAG: NADH-quinone oxidoreductase subunit J [Dehalococcoidia bacterium]|nr:NADH-quinone oxidoreductase subunit J [Dehalococcoidia bacterium]